MEKEQARQIKKFIDFEFELGRADVSNSQNFQSIPISQPTPKNQKLPKSKQTMLIQSSSIDSNQKNLDPDSD